MFNDAFLHGRIAAGLFGLVKSCQPIKAIVRVALEEILLAVDLRRQADSVAEIVTTYIHQHLQIW
ncbi:MAG: hypothetical protein HYV60_06255 [Planctomycetia bacterium]|nr:hypothetical protein [Planctomycetia bacterium]